MYTKEEKAKILSTATAILKKIQKVSSHEELMVLKEEFAKKDYDSFKIYKEALKISKTFRTFARKIAKEKFKYL